MEPLSKNINFNIGPLKAKFLKDFKRTILIKESESSQFNVLEIGSIEYNNTSIVLAVKEGTEEGTIIPFICETIKNNEYIIIFDYECYTHLDDQKYRCYIAHEVGHIISELSGIELSYKTFEEKEKEVQENKFNHNEHYADVEALKLIGNKNTYIKSLNYLIQRISNLGKEDLRLKTSMIGSIKLRIKELQ